MISPSKYQKAVIKFMTEGKGSGFVNAVAGRGLRRHSELPS